MTAPLGPDAGGLAPSGERLGLAGWMRALGFQLTGTRRAPPRLWPRHNVCLVSDESELVSFSPGPRGSVGGTRAQTLTEFSCFELVAGATGARVTIVSASTASGRGMVHAGPVANINAGSIAARAVQWSDPNRLGSSTVRSFTVSVGEPNADAATWLLSSATPGYEWWVPPGRFLTVWRNTANQALDIGFLIREPGSAPG